MVADLEYQNCLCAEWAWNIAKLKVRLANRKQGKSENSLMALRNIGLGAAALLTLSACGSGDEAATDGAPEPAVIDQRQDNFEEISDAFRAIRGELEGEEPDMAAIVANAEIINANAVKIEGFFPEGTGMDDGYDSEALATIWEQPEEFASAQQRLVSASEAFLATANEGDAAAIGEAVGDLGGACKNCHDTFRLDDE